MACPVVFANRNESVLVDIEWSGEALREHVNDVVAIRTIVELNAKRVLPNLRFENVLGIRSVKR